MTTCEFLIDDRQGNVYSVPIEQAKWTTVRVGAPGRLEFTYLRGSGIDIETGYVARLDIDGQTVFYGYVFSVRHQQHEQRRVVAYDQMRYMLFEETYVFQNKTASQMLRMMAEDVGLSLGEIEDTGYVMNLAQENKKLLDIAYEALNTTLTSTRKLYTLYDDGGALCLKSLESMRTDLFLGDQSLVAGYDYETSIDEDTYNRVKIVKKNEQTGRWEVFIHQDSQNIARWGTLQLYQVAEETAGDAQIDSRAGALLKLKNRETQSLSLTGLGDLRARAGAGIYIGIKDEGIDSWFVIDEADHTFKDGLHEMKVKLKVV